MHDDDPTRKMGIDPPIGETTVLGMFVLGRRGDGIPLN